MNYPLLNAKVLTLKTGETLVIRFATKPEDNEPEFSGELRISSDFEFLPIERRKEIQRVLAIIAPLVTTYYIK
jgi:hypothetical protein